MKWLDRDYEKWSYSIETSKSAHEAGMKEMFFRKKLLWFLALANLVFWVYLGTWYSLVSGLVCLSVILFSYFMARKNWYLMKEFHNEFRNKE